MLDHLYPLDEVGPLLIIQVGTLGNRLSLLESFLEQALTWVHEHSNQGSPGRIRGFAMPTTLKRPMPAGYLRRASEGPYAGY